MPRDQMTVAEKHAPGFKAARSVKRFEDADENILAPHSPERCSFNFAHR
jgi:hypothetical protein